MNLFRITTRARALAVLACGLTATTLLTGCGNGLRTTATGNGPVITSATAAPSTLPSSQRSTQQSTQPSPGSGTSEVRGSTGAATSTAAQPSSSRPDPSSRSDRCTTGHLQVGVRASQGGAAAGSNYVLLTYRNTGAASCVLTGFPGVSFVGHSNGTQLGDPAIRSTAARSLPVRIPAGRTTTSLLQIANAGNYDPKTCVPTTADGFRVYPPGSTTAVFVAFRTPACQRPTASSPQLVASPVGTGG